MGLLHFATLYRMQEFVLYHSKRAMLFNQVQYLWCVCLCVCDGMEGGRGGGGGGGGGCSGVFPSTIC